MTSAATQYPHLMVDSSGRVRIGAARYTVLHLAGEHYHYGWSAEELLRQHPDLSPAEVYAALAYFYDRFEELRPELERQAAADRPAGGLTRAELLRRRSSGAGA